LIKIAQRLAEHMTSDYTLRPAVNDDYDVLSSFFNDRIFIHRHLDWRSSLDWLDKQPYWLMFKHDQLLAALACPPDPPGIAWIRLFASSETIRADLSFQLLFECARRHLPSEPPVTIATLGLQSWFSNLLTEYRFVHHQDIVVLKWTDDSAFQFKAPIGVSLRKMSPADLFTVAKLDNISFQPIWQNSFETLSLAFSQSAYATIAEFEGEIIGYQICTSTHYSGHLARLAVDPAFQKHGIGHFLVQDVIEYFKRNYYGHLTVNTQSDNHSSLALYKKAGFTFTGDTFPIFIYPREYFKSS
jgi:ribosomal protein S18 acetylase RimI-like enzyme